jgi:hypothetical protein
MPGKGATASVRQQRVGAVRFNDGEDDVNFSACSYTRRRTRRVPQNRGKSTSAGVSVYLEAAAELRARAATARSPEARAEFERLAALNEKLAPISAAPPRSSAWQGVPFNFDRKTIVTIAPSAAGVYILWRPDRWIYVGECLDLRSRLISHMDGDNASITQEEPRGFGFELITSADLRVARREALIRALAPLCVPLPE